MDKEQVKAEQGGFFGVSPYMIFPNTDSNFSIFLRFGNHYILYARKGEDVTERHKAILYETGWRRCTSARMIGLTMRNTWKKPVQDPFGRESSSTGAIQGFLFLRPQYRPEGAPGKAESPHDRGATPETSPGGQIEPGFPGR